MPTAVDRPLRWLLARGRHLRGTPFDPFGRTSVRRLECRLVPAYTAAVRRLLDGLSGETLDSAVEVAAAAMEVRGYEGRKLVSGQASLTTLEPDGNPPGPGDQSAEAGQSGANSGTGSPAGGPWST